MDHVLIVEDNEENRTLLKILLEVNGYRVTVAGDGLEALAAAQRDRPDAIVSDALMPKMDGFALCRAWMQDAGLRAIPFIFYSATYVHPEDEQFAMALGAVRYLIKPVEAAVFLRELREVLQEWTGREAPSPAAPLDEIASHALHESALARKMDDKTAQLEAANRKLQESETRFRSLTEMSSDFYWESDAEHRLTLRTWPGRKLSTVSVFERGTQIGERRWDRPNLSPDAAGWPVHRAVLDAHQPFREFELSRLGTDGTEHFISINGDPVFDAAGAFTGYRGVGTDITERKRAEDALRESTTRLEEFSRRLLQVQEEERHRIARELHDRVGQTLSALGTHLELVRGALSAKSGERVQPHLTRARELIELGAAHMRELMAELRPPGLEEYGLLAALRVYTGTLAALGGAKIELRGKDLVPRPPRETEIALFRIAQEALANAEIHARAQRVEVSLEQSEQTVNMSIADDGVGFDSARAAPRPSWGLDIMRERAEAAGASLRVDSAPGRGTRVSVEAPWRAP